MFHQFRLVPSGKPDKYMAACSCHGWAAKDVSAKKGNAGYLRHLNKVRKQSTKDRKKA